ncbi:hypothetical protein AN644_01795, partial [Candidatus Epulonipiscium fishelsonii]
MAEGLVSRLQTYSTKDGPGIRTTAFFISCNLRCVWCANPESMYPNIKLFHQQNFCKQCGKCVALSEGTITLENNKIVIDRENCKILGKLPSICNYNAYVEQGQLIDAETLAKKLARDKHFFYNSNGGVTFSGGEPFLQPELLLETMQKLKQQNIHIAIETAGLWDFDKNKAIVDLCDLFLFDIKAYDRDIHKKCTGVYNDKILETVIKIANYGKKLRIRLIIVPTFNDAKQDIIDRVHLKMLLAVVGQ